jgi:outer membrane protein TolC
MKLVWQKRILIISYILICMMIPGCISTEQFYDDVGLSREVAYRQWQKRKEQQRQSQPRIHGELSIQDCMKLALANNKILQRVTEEKEIARGERLKSLSAILPSIDVSGDYRRLDEVSSFTIGPQKITMGDVDNYTVGLRVTQPVFAGGAIPAQIHSARLFTLLTDQTVRAAVQDVIYTAVHSYYDVLLNQHLLEISNDAVRSAQVHLDNVRQRWKGGVVSNFDVLRAEVELSNFQADLIRNRNAINIAKTQLLKVMGVSQDSDFNLSDELLYVSLEMTMEKAVETAFQSRPDLFSREFDIKYQKELLKISRSRYWPVVSGYYDNTWSKPDPHNTMDIEWGYLWQAGVMATIPLFDGLSREGEVVAQKARVRQAQIDLVDAEETALFELTTALLSIADAVEFVESQRMNQIRAEEGLRLAEVGYKQGTNTQVEMIDAQAALTTASVNYYQAIYSHIIAKLDLQKAMGTLATFEADENSQ